MNESDTSLANNTGHFNLLTTGVNGGTATMRVARSTATNNSNVGFYQVAGGTFQVLAGTNMVEGSFANKSGTITAVGTDTNP